MFPASGRARLVRILLVFPRGGHMSKRQTQPERRRLSVKRETLRRLSGVDLARVAGGTGSWVCVDDTSNCDTECCESLVCGYGTTSKFC
jgi:hypothetical protein